MVTTPASHLIGHLGDGCLAVGGAVGQQVPVEVGLAGVALGTVRARVGADTAMGQHVLLQVKLPPQTFPTLWTRVRFFSWTPQKKENKEELFPKRPQGGAGVSPVWILRCSVR